MRGPLSLAFVLSLPLNGSPSTPLMPRRLKEELLLYCLGVTLVSQAVQALVLGTPRMIQRIFPSPTRALLEEIDELQQVGLSSFILLVGPTLYFSISFVCVFDHSLDSFLLLTSFLLLLHLVLTIWC